MKREEVSELVERGIRELNDALAAGKSESFNPVSRSNVAFSAIQLQ